MAVSGSIDFGQTRDDAITEALELIGVLGEGESPNANQLSSCARTLNLMIKAWQGRGVNIFAVETVYVFLAKDTSSYTLNASGDHSTNSYVSTTLSAAASSGASTITVSTITGMSNGDFIGVELDDGTLDWTTINGAPSGSTVTLTATLDSAAASGNRVFVYTTKANRPLKVLEAYRRTAQGIDVPLDVTTDRAYHLLADKNTDGVVNTVYYDPQITSPTLYVWPQTSEVTDVIMLRVKRTLNDLDSATDDIDFPQEWYHAIALNLALHLCPKYGVSSEVFNQLGKLALQALFDAESHDTEHEFKLFPDHEGTM